MYWEQKKKKNQSEQCSSCLSSVAAAVQITAAVQIAARPRWLIMERSISRKKKNSEPARWPAGGDIYPASGAACTLSMARAEREELQRGAENTRKHDIYLPAFAGIPSFYCLDEGLKTWLASWC